jgi:hypothetical protein
MRVLLTITFMSMFAVAAGCSGEAAPPGTEPGGEPDARQEASDEAQARKDRSVALLKAEEVPVIEELPVIATEAESTRRTTEEVALRAMALCLVATKGKGMPQTVIDELAKEYEIDSALTPKEKEFIANPNPTEQQRIEAAWRYESYWVMLWALGFVDKLERPDKICDVDLAVSFLQENGRDGFLKKAKLRPQSEILDAADLIYRYHWAVVDANFNGREAPAGLDPGVVWERHYALNWLIGYKDQEWDDVTTDT